MTCKTILVYFRNEHEAPELATAAGLIAEQCQAHVVGLYVTSRAASVPVTGFPLPQKVLDAAARHEARRVDAVKAVFEKHAGLAQQNWEWRYVNAEGSTVSHTVSNHAQCADLIVMGQPSEDTSYIAPDMTFETALMGSGRPVLVVPRAMNLKTCAANVAIAWDGSREAARAAFDALPLMRSAKNGKVTLLWLQSRIGHTELDLPGSELAASLARHGLDVETLSAPIKGSVGESLLTWTDNLDADLLVMGCYGHSRLREFVFGGATDHVVRNMKIPVLMAH